jgi:beta-galactosidase
MTTIPFIDGWTFRRATESEATPVLLPHDAMIAEPRSAKAPSGSHGSYFPGGRYVYAKTWTVPADGLQRSLVFEGVYGDTEVRVNGSVVGTSISGYREFSVPLPSSGTAVIEIEVDNSHLPNSRWYTGSGIYRGVSLVEVAPAHILSDGLSFTTVSLDGPATVEVAIDVENPDVSPLTATVTLTDADGNAVSESAPLTSRAELTLTVPQARLWSAESPHLYRASVLLTSGENTVDTRELNVGLRTVAVDATRGLQVNGAEVLLRGACVHHDSGVLGAATLRASEFRRARILKEGGFNAIRSSHNPLSRDLLDACDELGLYVLDELTDVWFGPKSAHDVAPHFEVIWRDDARSMVAKDRNHPSVIMYSIGNEIAESGSERGVTTAHDISDFVRELDPTRPTTFALNFLLNVMAASGRSLFDTREHDAERIEKKPTAVTSTVANVMANRIGGMMQTISKLPKADRVSRDTFTAVDVAGYNYAWGRYRGDAKRHPDRVVLGSESMPGDLPKIWPLVQSLPNVIGDFLWTGWDYLGETGIGTWSYGSDSVGIGKAFPELVAGCGLIDITGVPGAALLLAQATWDQLEAPQIAVRPLDHATESVHRVAWRSTDAVQSWSWSGCEGVRADIEVYSTDEQVELVLNGRSLGRRAAGARRGFVTRYRVAYEPGELVAIGYRGGVEVSRSLLRSALTPALRAIVEPGQGDAYFVRIEIADSTGTVEMLADDEVTVAVSGGGVLAGFGSAAPATIESFADDRHSTFRGRALAVVRPTGGAPISVSVTSARHGSALVVL